LYVPSIWALETTEEQRHLPQVDRALADLDALSPELAMVVAEFQEEPWCVCRFGQDQWINFREQIA
jgi:hypothetical protein